MSQEVNRNPLTFLDLTFEDGARLRLPIEPPVSQARVMMDLGRLLATWGVPLSFRLPPVPVVHPAGTATGLRWCRACGAYLKGGRCDTCGDPFVRPPI